MSASPFFEPLSPVAESPEAAGERLAEAADSVQPMIDIKPYLAAAALEAKSAAAAGETAAAEEPATDLLREAIERLSGNRTAAVRVDDLWPEAGRKILRYHLERTLARVPRIVEGDDPEDVHAMRVAARRMRAAWRVFGDGFEPEPRRRYVRDLRELGARLGAVRDLDVLLGILTTHAQHHGERGRTGLAPLLRAWSADREARRVELVGLLGSAWFGAFVTEYAAIADTEGLAAVRVVPRVPSVVRTRMPSTVWAAYEAVWAFDDGLAGADLAALHRLRITAKWLRYALEFVREALEPEATPLIRAVVALQDRLGDQHDQHVAATLARRFAAGSEALSKHELRATDRFVRELDEGVAQSGRAFQPAWRALVAPDYRRRLGRALARL